MKEWMMITWRDAIIVATLVLVILIFLGVSP
jgi:hypothetical protein